MKIYKIRDKTTGLFSKGGMNTYRLWSKNGKTWSNIGHVKNHLNQWLNLKGEKFHTYPYENAEIVEIEVNYNECNTINVNEIYNVLSEERKKWWNKT